MTSKISPAELRKLIYSDSELALLDVREAGVFTENHLFYARSLPLSRLELNVDALVPRKSVPIVVIDNADDGLAVRGAEVLSLLGYSNVTVLDGGLEAWGAAGLEVFTGANVPSKAFGEFVEKNYSTPRMPAQEVKALMDEGANLVILDSRPYSEYHRMNIPGGINTPGAELVHRVSDLAPDPETLVIVNCAGRTRSIIGSQSLINAGIPNRVVALKDGTMGWHLAGLELERGQDRIADKPSPNGLKQAQEAAARVAKRFGILQLDLDGLSNWRAEADERTVFLLDVRSPEEFQAGHMADSVSAPGGQLIQGIDEYVGVLGARIILVDDNAVRATMTASWLVQMGWRDVAVFSELLDGPLKQGHSDAAGGAINSIISVTPAELTSLLKSSETVAVLDLSPSIEFRNGHIPGAIWTTRVRLHDHPKEIANIDVLVLMADDDALARLTAQDMLKYTPASVLRVLPGGTRAWLDAGKELEIGMTRTLLEPNDVSYKPYQKENAVEQEMQKYLDWEVALLGQLEREGDVGFRMFD